MSAYLGPQQTMAHAPTDIPASPHRTRHQHQQQQWRTHHPPSPSRTFWHPQRPATFARMLDANACFATANSAESKTPDVSGGRKVGRGGGRGCRMEGYREGSWVGEARRPGYVQSRWGQATNIEAFREEMVSSGEITTGKVTKKTSPLGMQGNGINVARR